MCAATQHHPGRPHHGNHVWDRWCDDGLEVARIVVSEEQARRAWVKNVAIRRQRARLQRSVQLEPLKFAPVTVNGRRTLSFEGVTVLGPLLDPALLPTAYKGLASPTGFEPVLPP